MKIRELESKLDLEATSKTRLETQISRLKEQIEKLVSGVQFRGFTVRVFRGRGLGNSERERGPWAV